MKTPYNLFFETHAFPTGWRQEYDYLLYNFLANSMPLYAIEQMQALLTDNTHPELPDDWGSMFAMVLPRKDYVYFVDKPEAGRIALTHLRTWEGNPLLDETSVERNCTKYLKIPTGEMLKLCQDWEAFEVTE